VARLRRVAVDERRDGGAEERVGEQASERAGERTVGRAAAGGDPA